MIEELPNDLDYVLNLYNKSDSMGQLVTLSLIDPKKYTKQKMMEIFICIKYKTEQERKWNAINLGLVLPTNIQFKRNKLNASKCEHFFRYCFYQWIFSGFTTSRVTALMVCFLFILSSQPDFQYCNSNCKIKKNIFVFNLV